ncbi:MAG TPA: hypothetical protein DCM53_20055 [Enterobacteriaceae bacterium]|nr:hypothetical protein [Enterobacteriaceae bacterium]
MAKPNTPGKPYTKRETDYIRRVAGKVPVIVMAEALNRTPNAIRQYGWANKIDLRVPRSVMLKHWPEYAQKYPSTTE